MMRIIVSISFLVLLFFSTSCSNSEAETTNAEFKISTELFKDLDQQMIQGKKDWLNGVFNRLHRRNGFIGSVLYAEKGNVIYQKAFGYSDLRKRDSLSIHSSYQLASVSKMFTAMSIMILKQNNQLNYDDDLRKYLVDFPYEGVTIRMLLTHRSGLPRYMSLAHEQWKEKTLPLTNESMYDLFINHSPSTYGKPDEYFHYCNTNYALLANIVEVISGLPFNSFVQINIFDPLEMEDSFVYHMPKEQRVSAYISEGVPGYRYSGWRPIKQRNEYLNGVMGDKGVYSSVVDLYKFDQALNTGLLVHDSVLKEAFKPGSPKYRRQKDNYGFGWRTRTRQDSTVYHYGWWKGFRAFYIRDMKQEKTIIVLSNRAKGPGSSSLWSIINNKEYPIGRSCELDTD